MSDIAIIYYTANTEDMEPMATEQILKVSGGLPVISVSHAPMDFGKNICVGKQFPCDFNIYRQLLVGCEETKAEYVFTAESDTLYPPDYFSFRPDGSHDIYRYDNVLIMFHRKPGFRRKLWTEGGQLAKRKPLVKLLRAAFKDKPEWGTCKESGRFSPKVYDVYRPKEAGREFGFFGTEKPIISCKTSNGLRFACGVDEGPLHKVPYWGNFRNLYQKVFAC